MNVRGEHAKHRKAQLKFELDLKLAVRQQC